MKILALELSSGQGSIVMREDEREVFAVEFANERKHSGAFFENLQRCFDQIGKPDRIVVGLGPGSYAGTRIAIAAATGLQAATGVDLLGLPSFLAIATDANEYTVVGDARRQSFWLAQVRARRCVLEPVLCTTDELTERLRFISHPIFSAERLAAFPEIPLAHPSARVLAELGTNSPDIVRAPLEPLYLREPHITQPKVART
ncbi:MAG: tRNA (adenosine(37)-N6)-threonylcarbamoyltransferase complex dimerization subunit type 1 TsaB [Chthoniobacterales bacterium]